MCFEKKDLKEVLKSVDTTNLSESATKAYDELCCFLGIDSAPEAKTINLVKLNEYKATVLWDGEDDVVRVVYDFMIEDVDETYADLTEEERDEAIDELIETVTNSIDWNADAFTSCEDGNEVICQAISEYLKKEKE